MRGAIRFCVFILLAAAALQGCRSPSKTALGPSDVAPNGPADPWVLSTHDLHNKTPALLWNGLIGMRLGRDGTGADVAGKPLPMFFIDEYETAGEEKIKPIASFLQFKFSDGSTLLDLKTAGPYTQTLDMRSGVLKTVWNQPNANTFNSVVQSEVIVHPTKRIVGIRFTLESDHPHKDFFIVPASPLVGKSELFEGERKHKASLQDGDIQIEIAETRRPMPNSDPRSKVQIPHLYEVVISFGRSQTGRAMRLARHTNDLEEAPNWDKPEPAPTFEKLLSETRAYWAKAWQTDIEIDGPVEDQQAVRSFLFYLRSAIHPEGQMSISPFGLSNARYNGHVFWDADTWVFPALALVDPEKAKAIPEYRLSTRIAAMASYVQTTLPNVHIQGQISGARYAWESSVTGREVAPTEMRNEIHVGGCVALTLRQAAALALEPLEASRAISYDVATFFRSWVHRESRWAGYPTLKAGTDLEIRNVVSPDEFHRGNNDLYTNLVAQTLQDAIPNDTWPFELEPGSRLRYKLPQDSTSFLTYDGDKLRGYKQAAAVLAIYPLQYPPAEKQAKVMMDRFADKVTPNGPAMSDSVHALIWARIGERDKAYATWKRSWQRYTGAPLMLFSEKPETSSPQPTSSSQAGSGQASVGGEGKPTYFATGAGGCVQTILYGFLGFRIDSREEMGAAWSKPLLGGQVLSVKPNLPKEWKRVKLKNFTVLGKRYTLTADHSGATVVETR